MLYLKNTEKMKQTTKERVRSWIQRVEHFDALEKRSHFRVTLQVTVEITLPKHTDVVALLLEVTLSIESRLVSFCGRHVGSRELVRTVGEAPQTPMEDLIVRTLINNDISIMKGPKD
jgi:hypothetical protein